MSEYLFTSESVSEGHPDKVADQISDAILDAIITQDSKARVACETYIKTGIIIVGGEITTTAKIDIEELIRNTIRDIGYVHSDIGFDADSCAILNTIGKQSSDISHSVNLSNNELEDQCAGDQGSMFGYATNETDVFMPIPITYAHKLMEKHAKVRKEKILSWLRPDAKCQITFVYNKKRKVISIHSIVFSTQHTENISISEIKEGVMEEIIKPTLPKKWLNNQTRYYINPTNRFVIGGPTGDCGLTGRKIAVDTYGGMARHGGGAFSGKDPSKMDRSASYYARYVAKNIVAAGLAEKIEIQISYAIGIKEPISLSIETFGTEKVSIKDLMNLINCFFDFCPQSIISSLNLLQPIYKKTATYGHFGREIFPWENLDKISELREYFEGKYKIRF